MNDRPINAAAINASRLTGFPEPPPVSRVGYTLSDVSTPAFVLSDRSTPAFAVADRSVPAYSVTLA